MKKIYGWRLRAINRWGLLGDNYKDYLLTIKEYDTFVDDINEGKRFIYLKRFETYLNVDYIVGATSLKR